MTSWATTYRPRTFEQVRGQQEKVHLRLMLKQGVTFPPLIIMRGPSGTGKTTIARIMAAALNCEALGEKGDPCTVCGPCVAIHEGSFSGVYEHNAALRNGAEDMRQLQERSYLQSDGRHSVFILDEAQTLSGQAWKVLLKLFEEPPPGCIFVLITSEPNKIPRTIQTRAVTYEFGKVAPDEVRSAVQAVLSAEGNIVMEGLDLIVDLADGSVREALMLAEQAWRSSTEQMNYRANAFDTFSTRDTTLDILEAATDNDIRKGLAGIEAMWRGSANPEYIVDKLAEQMQNVTYRHYNMALYVSPETNERLAQVANKLGERRISDVLTVMSQWGPRVRTKAHLLFMWQDILKVLHGSAPLPQKAVAAPTVVEAAPQTSEDVVAALKGLSF